MLAYPGKQFDFIEILGEGMAAVPHERAVQHAVPVQEDRASSRAAPTIQTLPARASTTRAAMDSSRASREDQYASTRDCGCGPWRAAPPVRRPSIRGRRPVNSYSTRRGQAARTSTARSAISRTVM